METVKKIGVLLVLGFLGGAVVATLIAPSFLEWYNTPGSGLQAVCPCVDTVRHATSGLIKGQLTGGGLGAVVTVAAGILISRARAQGAAAAAGAGSTPKAS